MLSIMDEVLNGSSTTSTTMTLIDDSNDSIGSNSLVGSDVYPIENNDRDSDEVMELSSNTTFSQISQSYADSVEKMRQNTIGGGDMITHQIYNYTKRKFIEFEHLLTATCEDICIELSRYMEILPNCRYLFGLRVFHVTNAEEWALPGQPLRPNAVYCFRMRFKVPPLDVNLRHMDPASYEYLYHQMHYDVVHECIPEIQYPLKKDNIMGLGAVNMYIDLLEKRNSSENIEKNYKRYLPRPLVKAHKIFGKSKICQTFRDLCKMQLDVVEVKWSYVNEVDSLAPNYMLETYMGLVDFIPSDDNSNSTMDDNNVKNFNETMAYIKLDLIDTLEPGLKVARLLRKEGLQWKLVTKLENIYAVYVKGNKLSAPCCRLEITGMPAGYGIKFEGRTQLESFISYLSGYMRLTTKWMVDVCVQYITPSLNELLTLRCHGPIGGAFSFAKIRKRGDNCGSYIIRQCEKEYDTYYIDINTKSYRAGLQPEKYKTETFKITKKLQYDEGSHNKAITKWILHYNSNHKIFDKLTDLAQFIPAESEKRFRIPPSEYDKSPLLLICLPKHVQIQKNKKELNETELQRRRVEIFHPPRDLQWYHNSRSECDNGRIIKMRADWIQQGGFKDISVTLKILKRDNDFQTFINLANRWSRVFSPHILKLYGLTLTRPYSLVMEYSKFGPLNEFLLQYKTKVSLRQLLDVVQGLVRGIVYLQEHNIIHGFIRCCNLYVTKFDVKTQLLEAKISDPGLPRPYVNDDLPWIPFEYHNNLNYIEKDLNIDIWAFGTTVWEIFARGKPIGPVTTKSLRLNYNRYGGILPMPSDDCPQEMLQVMMDGWSTDSDKNFNHMQIFQRLIFVKENLDNDYSTIDGHSEIIDDDQSNNLECSTQEQDSAEDELPNGTSCKVGNHRSYFDITPSVLEIRNGKVIFKHKIGEGHFGTVHLGEVRYNTPANASEMVAIKTLKSLRTSQLNDDFMREIEIMETLDHPNIVKIKHWIQRPFCIIMEFLESGSFLVYLTSHKPNLTNNKLLGFAMDIARGMNYLVKKNIIHRDLAARNILVDRDSVKISDFGLAQKADSNGYYIGHSKRKIPIKWYSPETIRSNAKFSFQSDVWSYGVTLFEMFSRGEPPNLEPDKELSQDEFLLRLERGERLQQPALCPNNIYEQLMRPCWHHNPKLRPTFKEIIDIIKSIHSESVT